jgi:hypothetical protein
MLPMSLSVNSDDTPIGLGGYDRPPERIENVDEIEARFRENLRPLLVCSYCGSRLQTQDSTVARSWFKSHACEGEGVDIEEWLAA